MALVDRPHDPGSRAAWVVVCKALARGSAQWEADRKTLISDWRFASEDTGVLDPGRIFLPLDSEVEDYAVVVF